MQGECEFKKQTPKIDWIFNMTVGPGTRKLREPKYGEAPKHERAMRRCPLCNRRLTLKARYCIGGEFVFWEIPAHKPKDMRKPRIRRLSRTWGRGK